MTWPEWDAGPYPLDDAEADQLRRDIRDELADHLQSALESQRHVTRDEAEARRAVLARFGDPKTIARQLWLQAKEAQAMRERIVLAFAAVLTVVCLGALGLGWVALQDVRRSNEALLEKLSSLKLAAEPAAAPSERCSFSLELVKAGKGDKPAEGFAAELASDPSNPGERVVLTGKSDAQGKVAFASFPPGKYDLIVRSPWGCEHHREFLLLPGLSPVEKIVCPEPPPTAELSFAMDMPEDIRKRRPLVCAAVQAGFGSESATVEIEDASGRRGIYGCGWRRDPQLFVTFDAEGRILPGRIVPRDPPPEPFSPPTPVSFDLGGKFAVNHREPPLASLHVEARTSILRNLGILTPIDAPTQARPSAQASSAIAGNGVQVYEVVATASARDVTNYRFEVRPGQPNLWKIAPKPEVWSSLRNRLPKESPKAEPK